VIRVGLTPPPNAIGHSTNPNQGCFDDKEGDDSVEWPFYEALIDKLKASLCYDENRVFASGNSSGAWLANELACKYSGNTAGYAIRGIAVNAGGLPAAAAYVPTCTQQPMAGMWVEQANDPGSDVFAGWQPAFARAMNVNRCTGGSYSAAMLADFPIGGGKPPGTCKKVVGCPAEYPLVVCLVAGNGHASNDDTVNPGFATFFSSLEAP
jgi:poly(3-hydroxybutyrate) depolymerase